MMTDNELKRLARFIVQELANNKQLLTEFAKFSEPKRRLIRLSEAAAMLGISTSQLYHIKDNADGRKRFSYVKQGKARSCPVLFDETKVVEEYERYLEEKNNLVPMNFKKVRV